MTLDELRSDCVRLWNVENFDDLAILNEIYKNCLFQIMLGDGVLTNDPSSIKEAKIIVQVMFTKLAHLEQVCGGVTFNCPL